MPIETVEDLTKEIATIRRAIDDGSLRQSGHERAVEEIKTGMAAIEQRQRDLAMVSQTLPGQASAAMYRPYDDEVPQRDGLSAGVLRTAGGCVRLHAHGDSDVGLFDDPRPRGEWQREVQVALTNYNLARQIMAPQGAHPRKLRGRLMRALAAAPDRALARIFTDSSGTGAEFIPDVTLPELDRQVAIQTGVDAIFPTMEFDSPAGALLIPYASGTLRPRKYGVATVDNPSDFGTSDLTTASRTISVTGLVVAAQVDRDASEDSIIPVLPLLAADMAYALTAARCDAIINGDTDSTHRDTIASWNTRGLWGTSGLGATDDHRRSWDGLRKRTATASSRNSINGAETQVGIRTLVTGYLGERYLGKYGTGDLGILVSPEFFIGKMLASGFGMMTWDQVGPAAAILSGRVGVGAGMALDGRLPGHVGFVHGTPVIMTPFVTSDLASSGVYTGSGALSTVIVVDRTRHQMVTRRVRRVETEIKPGNGTIRIYATCRETFRNRDASTEKNVCEGYNAAVTAA